MKFAQVGGPSLRCLWQRFALAAVLALACAALPPAAHANVFTKILREAGEAGGKGASHVPHGHAGPLGKAAAGLHALPDAPPGSLAAHVTPEGHWQFVNREGTAFTAGTPEELARVRSALLPGVPAEHKLSLYLSEESAFTNRAAIDGLPDSADLHLVTGAGVLPLKRPPRGSAEALSVKIKANLDVPLTNAAAFDELVHLLSRRINLSNVRTIGFAEGGTKAVPSAPKLNPKTKLPEPDALSPDALPGAFRAIRGQTAIISGRVEGGKIYVTPAGGSERALELSALREAAAASDVDLVILQSTSSVQAGSKNWLWQTVEVGGVRDAAAQATYGDFLETLAARRGGFTLTPSVEGGGRVQVAAAPVADGASLTGQVSSVWEGATGHVIGEVITKGAEIQSRDQRAQSELDSRLIPGIPSYVQYPYLIAIFCGLIGWQVSRGWWARLWPAGAEGGWRHNFGRKLAREAAYLLAFLPAAGVPALIWQGLLNLWATVSAPFRWLKRLFGRQV